MSAIDFKCCGNCASSIGTEDRLRCTPKDMKVSVNSKCSSWNKEKLNSSEMRRYKTYILLKNRVEDICDIDYSFGNGNQPYEVAKAGIIDLEKYEEEENKMMFNQSI